MRVPKIYPDEYKLEYFKASGPGGQNINKVATAVRLRFDVLGARSLNEIQKANILNLGGRKISSKGILLIEARRFRTRELNQKDAIRRLQALVNKTCVPQTKRIPTHPTRGSKELRLKEKKVKSEKKRSRKIKDVRDQ